MQMGSANDRMAGLLAFGTYSQTIDSFKLKGRAKRDQSYIACIIGPNRSLLSYYSTVDVLHCVACLPACRVAL